MCKIFFPIFHKTFSIYLWSPGGPQTLVIVQLKSNI